MGAWAVQLPENFSYLIFSRSLIGSHLTRCGKLSSGDATCRAQVFWVHSELWPHPGLPVPTFSPAAQCRLLSEPSQLGSVPKSYAGS